MKKAYSYLFVFLGLLTCLLAEPLPKEDNSPTVMDWHFWDLIFTRSDMSVLPNGNHNFFPLEYWYPGAVLANADNGGFSQMEPVTLAIHGESVKWLRHRLNTMDITNPADPGRPFIYLPLELWSSYEMLAPLYSYSDNMGLNWSIHNAKPGTGFISAGVAGFMGGKTWMPAGVFDRDPAQDFGASWKRRGFGPSPEGSGLVAFKGLQNLPAMIFYEGLTHYRTFTALNGYDKGSRNTLYLGQDINENLNASFIYQRQERNHLGIETGNPDTNTLTGASDSFLLTLAAKKPDDLRFSWAVNTGYSHKKYDQNNPHSMVFDLTNRIVYAKMPLPAESHSWFIGNRLDFNRFTKLWIFDASVDINSRIEGLHEKSLLKNNLFGQIYNGTASTITLYQNSGLYSQYLLRTSPQIKLKKQWTYLNLEFNAGALLESGFSPHKYLLTRIEPVIGIKLHSNFSSPWEVYTGIQHDAVPVSMDELRFLNPDSPSGARYAWTDSNLDGIPQANEIGTLYNNTGGKYHNASPNLKFPSRDEIYIGVGYNFSQKWKTFLSLHAKRFANLYTVGFDSSVNSGYYAVSNPLVTGGTVYNRNPSTFGSEKYSLTNTGKDGYYGSIEIQVLKKNDHKDPWFLQVSLGAYYSQAYTLIGNGPDYNDMGQFAESSANPNKQLNTLAITDYDRAYGVNILFGFNSGPFSIANTIRYRDGQPFGRMMVVTGLNDGPVIIQNQTRAEPPTGMPRYTFALTWDVRFRYELSDSIARFALTFDIYNLLDSRTELYEYTIRNQNDRLSIESVTGRSYRLLAHWRW